MTIKGLRDLPVLQRQRQRGGLSSRREIATELARLEHSKVRLENELAIWQRNLQRTTGRLEEVEQSIAQLRQKLDTLIVTEEEGKGAQADTQSAPRQAARPQAPPTNEQDGPQWHEVSFEY